ncbi:LLM class flavin-dependent oxidoreductase [Nocardia sp. NPDC051570]|uniref:LLM class flavin-dependent oxidoreductase n=1 Tax=Nocardia sp. NPDC051570 TaxID=3364324 RepID=UPI0037A9DDFE
MRFGLSFLPDGDPGTQSASAYYKDALRLCREADRAGLDFVKMTEHYLKAYGGYCPSPLQFLSAVAACTDRIRLMTGGIMAMFHHPVQIAAQTAMLDALSQGRAEIGFARAYLPYEFDAFGVPLDGSRERFMATVQTVRRLWTEETVTVDTPYFTLREATNLPRCVQQPHPPTWIAAVQSRQSFAWIAEQGFKLLVTPGIGGFETQREFLSIYRESFRPHPSNPDGVAEVALSLPIFIAKDRSTAVAESDRYLRRYLDVWTASARAWDHTRSDDYPRYTGFGNALAADTSASMRDRRAALVGGPDEIVQQISELKDYLDIDTFLWQIDCGTMPGDVAMRTLDLFVDKVRPQL